MSRRAWWRWTAVIVIVAALGGAWTLRHWVRAVTHGVFTAQKSQRDELKTRMKADPGQSWPRGISHVVLAWPGSRLEQKGYLEPGGSFSPGVGSFGILIQSGACNSATVPLDQVRQHMDDGLGVTTETPCYTADWVVESPATYLLNVAPRGGQALSLLLRSDGPAGGPLTSIVPDDQGVVVNGAWRIEPADGHPLQPPRITGSGSWLQAVIPAGETRTFRVRTLIPLADSPVFPAADGLKPLAALPVVHVPDARFAASLRAQAQHLLMGLVEGQTRPGDPVNYPLSWARDGAYVVSVLARAGLADTATALAPYFARHDYFGGFGPEADAPGLSLWALDEVAERTHNPAFAASIWPDVYRKAEMIVKMRHARNPIYAIAQGPIVPALLTNRDLTLVCEPSRNGLIVGRMDWRRPLLFVNGAAYAGLKAAARIARRRPEAAAQADAARWDREAEQLRTAWWQSFNEPAQHREERSAIVGLWPSTVADDNPARYSELLREDWDREHDSAGNPKSPIVWSYFAVAKAHQWLLAEASGAPEARKHVWQTLNWMWSHQTAPGLYTWSEGTGEENSFGLWADVRGWVNPPYVTPHYWTAAEMLGLQLDMLVHENDDGRLVIGLGVPDDWLAHPMDVEGVVCSQGSVAWKWDGKRLDVRLNGKPASFIAGPAFRRAGL